MTTPKYKNLFCQTSKNVGPNTRVLVVLLKKAAASMLIDQSNIHCGRVTFLCSYKYMQRARDADIIFWF